VVKLGVSSIPFSGKQDELLEEFGISAKAIISAIRSLLKASRKP